MTTALITGIIGSLILVTGAAWPPPKQKIHPTKSLKNWLFAIGGLVMLVYAILGYMQGGSIFFIFLEILIVIASALMMLDTHDKIDTPIISIAAIALIVWSLYISQSYLTIIFILGLAGVGLGYAFDENTTRRNAALTFGSILITIFSYLEANWIFFWLNLFFALFSAYYLLRKN